MHEHWEVWTWNGIDWNKEIFDKAGPNGEEPEGLAQLFYGRHIVSMPNCPAKLVRVVAEDEWYGKAG